MKNDVILGGFRKKSMPLSANYRPLYKIGLIVCILHIACNGNKSSLNRLHFFIWSLKSRRNMQLVRDILEATATNKITSWNVEPALNRALNFGVSEGLFSLDEDRYSLTQSGILFFKVIEKEKDLFVEEKLFLQYIGKRKITETFITQLTLNLSN